MVEQKIDSLRKRPDMDQERLEYELRVHQIELEMQNDQLRRSQVKLEQSRTRYFDLFDLAPVGYFTLGGKNLIIEANLAGAAILGEQRSHLAGRRFTGWIPREFQDVFYLHRRKAIDTQDRQRCELKLRRNDGNPVWVEMTTTATHNEEDDLDYLRIAVSDISERKAAEAKMREYRKKLRNMASWILSAQDRERKRIAVGLHDNVSQMLVLAKLGVESSLPSISNPIVSSSLKNVVEHLEKVIREAEYLTFELSDPLLRELGFAPAIKRYLEEEIQDKHRICCEFRVGEQRIVLDDNTKMQLYRIARELIANVVVHAHAKHLTFSVICDDNRVCASVNDDGVGFEAAREGTYLSKRSGFGLFSIKEQLMQMGGHLAIESEPGKGTTASVVVPIPRP